MSDRKVVVLDDDPTGTQTVADVDVVTAWDVDLLSRQLAASTNGFFILTNSRSLSETSSIALHREIAFNLRAAADNQAVTLISRSDSTLRGHFPSEVETLQAELGEADLVILAPFFEAGGRLTIAGEHFLAEDDQLIPVSETPFAQDSDFGFTTSRLADWVEEKSGGRRSASEIASIDLDTLRQCGPEGVEEQLRDLPRGTICTVDSICQRDMEVFVAGAFALEQSGKTILYRSAAGLVASRFGLPPLPPLKPGSFRHPNSSVGGLVVVGSYVPKTTEQLAELRRGAPGLATVELDVPAFLAAADREAFLAPLRERLADLLGTGRDALLCTSRDLVSQSAGHTDHLAIGQRISQALVDLVRSLSQAPRFVLAKGGITSSDIATGALGIRHAMVRGQLIPGVPVWRTIEGRFPNLDYVIFPGNVGARPALLEAYRILSIINHNPSV